MENGKKTELFLEYKRLMEWQIDSHEKRIKSLEDGKIKFARLQERVLMIGGVLVMLLTTGVTILWNYLLKK